MPWVAKSRLIRASAFKTNQYALNDVKDLHRPPCGITRLPALTQSAGPRVALVIPTLNAGSKWLECLTVVASQTLTLGRRLVVDSSSTDGTVALARQFGFDVQLIRRADFNHGGTRQWAVENLNDCEIIVFLTQDAILASPNSVEALVRCFDDPQVAVAYGRQLPHRWATPIEAHARLFNYGAQSVKKDQPAINRLGTKTFFCSNSFAAYRRTTLLELGGFRRDLILEEDAELAARAIKAGYANMYCAQALVYHSHDYTVREQMARYFDLGAFDDQHAWMREEFGSHSGEGLRFVKSELRYLARHGFWQIPRAWSQTAAKLLGYRLGRMQRKLPVSWKVRLSMSPGYWRRTVS
jgi:rhamnosyltransferase